MKAILFILVSFVVVTSIPSGIMLATVPDGSTVKLPLYLLETTPFRDFRIPGLVLSIIVGGTNLAALFLQMNKSSKQFNWSVAGGVSLSGFTTIQMVLTGAFHWLHMLYLLTGILITLIAIQLKGKWIV